MEVKNFASEYMAQVAQEKMNPSCPACLVTKETTFTWRMKKENIHVQCGACLRFVCRKFATNQVQVSHNNVVNVIAVCDGCYNYAKSQSSGDLDKYLDEYLDKYTSSSVHDKELQMASHSNHPNIIRFHGKLHTKELLFPFLVYETNIISLADYLKTRKVPWSHQISILRDVARGMTYLLKKTNPCDTKKRHDQQSFIRLNDKSVFLTRSMDDQDDIQSFRSLMHYFLHDAPSFNDMKDCVWELYLLEFFGRNVPSRVV